MSVKEQLLITGSSFVPPLDYIWDPLRSSYDVHFSNIGNVVEILDKSNLSKTLLLIFFLEDSDYQAGHGPEVFIEETIALVCQRLSMSDSTVLMCFSTYKPSNIITNSKMPHEKLGIRERLQKICDEFKHFYILDLDVLFANVGYSSTYSYRNWYFSNSRLTPKSWSQLSEAAVEIFNRTLSAPKKVLILDCDNTLWGGVIGEDGIGGIVLGQDGLGKAFRDFQYAVLEIHRSGTLIGIASKNNEEEVWKVFDNHPQMVLTRDNIITSRINWENKMLSLQQMAKELNLGLESFVFWDDNPFERDQMRNGNPEVTTIEPPLGVELWPMHLRKLSLFSNFFLTREDQDKQKQYKSALEFQKEKMQTKDQENYLSQIELKARIVPIDESNLIRAEQLSLKTNQFNLRSIRMTAGEIKNFLAGEGNFGYLVELSDKFGNHGLVALFLVSVKKNWAFVEALNISCRVFGRKLEYWIAGKIQELSREQGASSICFESILTEKSRQVISNFLDSSSFSTLQNIEEISLISSRFTSRRKETSALYQFNETESKREIEGIYE